MKCWEVRVSDGVWNVQNDVDGVENVKRVSNGVINAERFGCEVGNVERVGEWVILVMRQGINWCCMGQAGRPRTGYPVSNCDPRIHQNQCITANNSSLDVLNDSYCIMIITQSKAIHLEWLLQYKAVYPKSRDTAAADERETHNGCCPPDPITSDSVPLQQTW